MDRGRTAK